MFSVIVLFNGFQFFDFLCEMNRVGVESFDDKLKSVLFIRCGGLIKQERIFKSINDLIVEERFEFMKLLSIQQSGLKCDMRMLRVDNLLQSFIAYTFTQSNIQFHFVDLSLLQQFEIDLVILLKVLKMLITDSNP